VAVPNIGKFMGEGKSESFGAELHNVQTATMAMLADSTSGNICTVTMDQNRTVTATFKMVLPP
jgi:hypothetical protein